MRPFSRLTSLCLFVACLALPAFAQQIIPASPFRELHFQNDEVTGPDIVCYAQPIPTLSVSDVQSQPFAAACAGHDVHGTLSVNLPSFLPAVTLPPAGEFEAQLASPVRASAGMDFVWSYDGLGPGWLSADIVIGTEAFPGGELKCATDDPSPFVSEGVSTGQAEVDISCDIGSVLVAPPELGLPENSLLLPVNFTYGFIPSPLHEGHPPEAAGTINAFAVYSPGAVSQGPDVSVTALEVVQTVQTAPASMEPANADPERRVPLIALKSSMLRVYVRNAQDAADGVMVEVEGRRNGVRLSGSPLSVGPVRPSNPDRSSAGGSVNIPLPWTWTEEGSVEITAEVSLFEGETDPEEDNNSMAEVFQFVSTAGPGTTLNVYYTPICYQPSRTATIYCPDDNTDGIAARTPISQLADLTAKVFPIPDFALQYRRLYLTNWTFRGQLTRDNRHHLLGQLKNVYQHIDVARRARIDQLLFWVPPEIANATRLLGSSDPKWDDPSKTGRVAFAANNSEKRAGDPNLTMAHEIGHNLGLRHTNTANGCSSIDRNTDWPKRGKLFDPDVPEIEIWDTDGDASIGEPGFDPHTAEFQPPTRTDMMSYCLPSWVSPYHYKKLYENCFQHFAESGNLSLACMQGAQIPYGHAKAPQPTPTQVSDVDYWIVSGSVRADGSSGTLDPVFRVASATVPDSIDGEGDHCLVVSGAAGRLAEHCFAMAFLDIESDAPLDEDFFSARIPAIAGATRIALTRNGRELAAVQATANAPQVEITSPQAGDRWEGGMQSVEWNASDADGDTTTVAVHYSPDGGQVWLPLDIGLQQDQLEVDSSQIESSDNTVIRVLASDGFNTTDQRTGPIQVVQAPRLEVANQLDLHNGWIGQAVERLLSVRNTGSGPLTITSITSSSNVVTSLTAVPLSLGAGEIGAVRLRFTPPSAGTFMGTLTLGSNDSVQPSVQVLFEGEGVTSSTPDVEAATAALDFGSVSVGQSAQRTLWFENFGPAVATITAIEKTGAAFNVETPTTPYELGVRREGLPVTFTPPAAGSFNGRVTIRSNSPEQPAIEVQLSGTGVAAGGGGPRPAINSGGVVDAASFRPSLAAGSIASIFGVDLAPGTDIATSTPLPMSLKTVRVLVDGRPAPLFFVSANQINFQMPYEVAAFGQASVVVERNGTASAPEAAQLVPNAPAIFANPATAEPIVQRHPALDLITARNPARPGDVLILFLTGIGQLSNRPASGSLAPASPLATALSNPTVTIGGRPATVFFAGLAPGYVGLGQINIQLPQFSAVAVGQRQSTGTLPLVVRFGEHSSPAVNLPVAGTTGGGSDVSVTLEDVRPRQAVVQDRLVVDYTIHKPTGASGTVTRRVLLSPNADVKSNSILLSELFLELDNVDDGLLRASGISLLDILGPGTYYVALEIEFPGDTNVANNLSSSLPVEIVAQRPAFDASINLQQVEPMQAGPGDSLSLSYSVAGADNLTATLQRSIYLSADATLTTADQLLNTRTVDVIDGSAEVISTNNFLPIDTVAGDYFVGIILESGGDRNPSNNVSTAVPIRVVSDRVPFDIGVQITDVSPRQVAAGNALTVQYTVENHSGARGIYAREIRLSTDAVITSADTLLNTRTFELTDSSVNLVSENNTVPSNLTPGSYFVAVVVETAGDTDLTDNVSTLIPITVTAPAAALELGHPASAPKGVVSDTPPPIQNSDN